MDLLSSTKTKSLEIGYETLPTIFAGVTNYSLTTKFDENAFRSTKKYTEEFILRKIDCQNELDLNFLSGFDELTALISCSLRLSGKEITRCLQHILFMLI